MTEAVGNTPTRVDRDGKVRMGGPRVTVPTVRTRRIPRPRDKV